MATFEFNNPSEGSAYFFLETITTSSFYPEGTPKYMEGTWDVNEVKSNARVTLDMNLPSASYDLNGSGSISLNGIEFIFTGSGGVDDDYNYYLDVTSWTPPVTIDSFVIELGTKFSLVQTNPPFLLVEILNDVYDPPTGAIGFAYGGTDQTYGNTIPYSINEIGGIFSGGSNYNFGLVTSSFIAGVVVQPGYSTFNFKPNITIPVNTIEFRGTGIYTVTITP
jgi:hypothetical protein